MGFNTTLVIMNDALHVIAKDADFGAKVAQAAAQYGCYGNKPVDVSSSGHCNAATVVDCHHADHTSIILVGGNCATVALPYAGGWDHSSAEDHERILKEWARKLGYVVSKKRRRSDPVPMKGSKPVLDLAAAVKE